MLSVKNIRQWNDSFCKVVENVGLVAFLFMMLLTTVDVVGAKAFLKPVPGSLDLMMLAQLISMSFALGASFVAHRHVTVDFLMPHLPKPIQKISRCLIHGLVFALFFTMGWRLFMHGLDFKTYGEVSPTIRIQLYPIVCGASAAFIPACIAALLNLIQSLREVFSHGS